MKKIILITLVLLVGGISSAAAQEVLTVLKVSAAPAIDGSADSIWEKAAPTVITVRKIQDKIIATNRAKQTGKYSKNWQKNKYTEISEVELRAIRTDDKIFFMARWKDSTRDDQHKPWKWQGDKETGEYIAGKEREDRLAFMFPIKGQFRANMLDGTERTTDIWQWKAARTNPVGILHDKSHIYSSSPLTGTFSKHYTADGTEMYVSRPGDGDVSPYKSNKVDPFVYQGDMVPRYLPFIPEEPDAADVSAKGKFENGVWTVETGRELNTGHTTTDTVFDPTRETTFAIAVFNNVGDHFHAVSQVIKLVYEQ